MESKINATFVPVRDLTVDSQIAGGRVTKVRMSKSGLTVFIDYQRPDGSSASFSQSTSTNIAIMSYECPSCGVQLNRDGTVDALEDEPAEHYSDCRAS